MWVYSVKKFLSNLLLGLGIIFIISPFFLFWFIHDDYDRYIWIIHGPFPFSHFGSGPFQLFLFVGLFLIGIALILISCIVKKCNLNYLLKNFICLESI